MTADGAPVTGPAPWWVQNGRDVIVATYERRDGGGASQILTSPVGREILQESGRLLKDHGDERLFRAQSEVRDGLEREAGDRGR